MRWNFLLSSAAGLVAALTAPVLGGVIEVAGVGGGVTLTSGTFIRTFGGPGPAWNDASLQEVHAALNGAGITTENRVTFVLADTDGGLAFLALIDRPDIQPFGNPALLQLTTVAAGTNSYYINDLTESVVVSPTGSNARVADGTFTWASNGGADAFAWANLTVGNTLTYRFSKVGDASTGLIDSESFQFVTSTAAGSFAAVPLSPAVTSFSDSGEYGFSVLVIPAPAAMVTLMGGLPLFLRRSRR